MRKWKEGRRRLGCHSALFRNRPQKDDQRQLLAAVCARLRAGEGVPCRFFGMNNIYLFIGEHKYWLMTDYNSIDPYKDEVDYVLNRARLYRDRRDFIIQPGDSGRREHYPSNPPCENWNWGRKTPDA